MKKRGHYGLTNTEHLVLQTLWEANEPLPRPEILNRMPDMDWNPNSIHLVLNSLIEKGYLKIDGLVRCGQSYGRTYTPTMSQMEFAADEALKAVSNLPEEMRVVGLFAALTKKEPISMKTLEALEELLAQRRSDVENK